MKFPAALAWFAGVFFILYGIAFAIEPHGMAFATTQLEPDTVSALVDIRATYGGMTIAVGVLIIYLKQCVSIQHSLRVVWLVLLCMAATRAVGFVADGQANTLMYLYFVAEILGAALAIYAAKLDRRAGAASGQGASG
jgi:hypothetical protein